MELVLKKKEKVKEVRAGQEVTAVRSKQQI